MGRQRRPEPERETNGAATAVAEGPAVSRFQRFRVERIHRSELKNAPYNPRKLDKFARQKLEKNLKKVGLLEPVIWNRRTGNLVGGHQRIAALDSLEGSSDYHLDVSVVDLDEKTEREQNVNLNNPYAQGQYDMALLDDLIRSTPDFDITAAGFEPLELESLYLDAGMETATLDAMLSPQGAALTSQVTSSIDDVLGEANAIRNEAKAARKAGDAAQTQPEPQNSQDDGSRNSLANVKAARQAFQGRADRENEWDFFFSVVFRSDAHKSAFLKAMGEVETLKHLDGHKLAQAMQIDLEAAMAGVK